MAGTIEKRRCAGMHKLAGIVGGVLVMALALLAPASVPVHAAIACTVNSTMDPSDPGNLTLRNAVGALNDGACAGDSITFDPSVFPVGGAQKITLDSASGSLILAFTTRPVTIDGSGAGVVVDGGHTTGNTGVRVFMVNRSVTATLNALTIQHGNTGNNGGGILNFGALTVTNSTVSANSTPFNGGGILNGGALTVTNSTLSANSAPNGDGGGIVNNGTLTVTNSTLSANSAPNGDGGGIRNSGALTVTNSTFSSNSAGNGGGILDGGTLTVTNSTFSGNSAGTGGGGGIVTFTRGTTLTNTIVANSRGGDLGATFSSGTFNGDNNLIGDGSGGLSGANGNRVGVPLLGPLGFYDGPTQTIPLLPGSPAIDAGAAVEQGPVGNRVPNADQRGKPRVGAPDIGAFESQGFTLTPAAGSTPQSAPVGTAFGPLALTVAATDPVEPVAGGVVTFAAPAAGPSATIAGSPATVGTGGQASVAATANGIGGAYTVAANATGAAGVGFHLTNTVSLVSIAVTPVSVTLKVGQVQQFTATGTYQDGSTMDLTALVAWSSDAPGVVGLDTSRISVDGSVKGTAKSAGGAHITATQGAVSGAATVAVTPPVLTGVQPAPAPASRPGGASASGAATAAPAPAPTGSPTTGGSAPVPAPTGR